MAEAVTEIDECESLEAPSQFDCCNTGCTPCVFEIYERRLAKRKDQQLCASRNDTIRNDLLSDVKFKPFVLLEKLRLTNDTYIFTFQPCINGEKIEQEITGVLPYFPGQHFILKTSTDYFNELNNGNKASESDVDYKSPTNVTRSFFSSAYTPISISSEENNCSFKVAIKLYENGKMSEYIRTLDVGHIVYFRGPYGDFRYFTNKYKMLIGVCMGTGIAPIYAIIKCILQNEIDETFIKLFYGCRKLDSVILRDEISVFCTFWNFTVKYYIPCYVPNSFSEKFGECFVPSKINETELLKELLLNKAQDECLCLICGTEEFNATMLNLFIKFGFNRNNIYVF